MLTVAMDAISLGAMVFLIGFCLHYLLYKRDLDYESDEDDSDDGNGGYYHRKSGGNSLLNKWMEFGGGYYGTVALIELIFIEVQQFSDFISDWSGVGQFMSELSVPMLVSFFVEQFINFAAAISWPGKYFQDLELNEIALFVIITYILYTLSKVLARRVRFAG